MNSKDFDKQMRTYETTLDQTVPPELWMVVRLDGINFTAQTKKIDLTKPFDHRFAQVMKETVRSLFVGSGFQVLYAYTMSDEISLLIHPMDQTYGRKTRKILSCLAGQASALFQKYIEETDALFAFDARISVLPHEQAVIDYFRWRQAEATRNCLNSYCYWKLREKGLNKRDTTAELRGKNFEELVEVLAQEEVGFEELPLWQRRGIGIYFEVYRKIGKNKKTKKKETSLRRRTFEEYHLPEGESYDDYLRDIIRWGTTDDRSGQLISQETNWFQREKLPDLLKTDKAGKYVVVYDRKIIDFFDDEDEAYAFALDRFGIQGHFMMTCIEEPRVYYV